MFGSSGAERTTDSRVADFTDTCIAADSGICLCRYVSRLRSLSIPNPAADPGTPYHNRFDLSPCNNGTGDIPPRSAINARKNGGGNVQISDDGRAAHSRVERGDGPIEPAGADRVHEDGFDLVCGPGHDEDR